MVKFFSIGWRTNNTRGYDAAQRFHKYDKLIRNLLTTQFLDVFVIVFSYTKNSVGFYCLMVGKKIHSLDPSKRKILENSLIASKKLQLELMASFG